MPQAVETGAVRRRAKRAHSLAVRTMIEFSAIAACMVIGAVSCAIAPLLRSPSREQGMACRFGTCALLIAVFPAAAVILYLHLGEPAALTLVDPAGGQHDLTVSRLAMRLRAGGTDPIDADGWATLAHAYEVLNRPADAVAAYAHAVSLAPGSALLHADFADTIARANGGRLGGRASAEVRKALAIDPANPKALTLAGSAALERRDYALAIDYWRRLEAAVPSDSAVAVEARRHIEEAVKMSTITVDIRLAKGSRARLDRTVLVIAWAASGVRVPVAMQRLTVRDLPATISLDDSMAMDPDKPLSAYPAVTVEARIADPAVASPASAAPLGRAEVGAFGSRRADIVVADGAY
jgi:cytochrome c-type biogenesis protein CcmH